MNSKDKFIGYIEDKDTYIIVAYKEHFDGLVVLEAVKPIPESGEADCKVIAKVFVSEHEEADEYYYIDYTLVVSPNEVGDDDRMEHLKNIVTSVLHIFEDDIIDFLEENKK
jgi:hypothetical protein